MAIKYKWLAGKLKEQLRVNYKMGVDKLPSEHELCKKYHVSRQTVRQALAVLEQEGLIEKRQGSGSFYTGLSLDGNRNIIGLLFPGDQEYIYPTLIHQLNMQFQQAGFETKVFLTDYSRNTEREILMELEKHPIRGLFVENFSSALPNPNMDFYKKLQLNGLPVLFFQQPCAFDSSFPYLKDANEKGAAQLVTYFSELGHTQIAGLFQMDQVSGQERYLGFSTTKRDIEKEADWYTTKDLLKLRKERDLSVFDSFIRQVLPGKTAIICDHDEIAYYLAFALRKAGYHLPEDISIATFGNSYFCESEILSLTSQAHKSQEMCSGAVTMLLDMIKGLPVVSSEIPWYLVVRDSTRF